MQCTNGCSTPVYDNGLCRDCYTAQSERAAGKCSQGCGKWAFDHGLCRPCLKSAGAKRAPGSAAGNALPDDPTEAWQGLRVKQRCEALDTAKFVQAGPKPAGHVRFVVISDTHDHHFCEQQGHRHPAPTIPEGDVLIHAGDFTSTGKEHEVAQFNAWLGSLPHKHKIVIAGNHDLTFDLDSYPQLCQRFHYGRMLDAPRIKDEKYEVEGLQIYGSPWQPRFCDWAFNLDRGEPLRKQWRKIPEGIDVLVTHGPPIGHGDECEGGHRAGCVDLLMEIQNRIKPQYHVFGHVHEGYGVTTDGQTVFMNASVCNHSYKPLNAPLIFDLPARQ